MVARRRRLVLAVGSGGLIILGSVAAALINELHGGWGWWIAAGLVVLAWAAGTIVLAFSSSSNGGRVRLGPGSVMSGGGIGGAVTTRTAVVGHETRTGDYEGTELDAGAVLAAGDIDGPVETETRLLPDGLTQAQGIRPKAIPPDLSAPPSS